MKECMLQFCTIKNIVIRDFMLISFLYTFTFSILHYQDNEQPHEQE